MPRMVLAPGYRHWRVILRVITRFPPHCSWPLTTRLRACVQETGRRNGAHLDCYRHPSTRQLHVSPTCLLSPDWALAMSTGLTSINRALNLIPKRAEQRQVDQLQETFVDSGVAAAVQAIDHQVLYGRRGTGKTHALRYLESELTARGDIAIYVDLRIVGSPEGLFMGDQVPDTERAARLLVDLLGIVHEGLLGAGLEDDQLLTGELFVRRLDGLLAAITTVRVSGEVEQSREGEQRAAQYDAADLGASLAPAPVSNFASHLRAAAKADNCSARFAAGQSASA